jgi:hypothetical protein
MKRFTAGYSFGRAAGVGALAYVLQNENNPDRLRNAALIGAVSGF